MIVGYNLPGDKIDPCLTFGPPYDYQILHQILKISDHVYVIDHANFINVETNTSPLISYINYLAAQQGRKIHVHCGSAVTLYLHFGSAKVKQLFPNLIFYEFYLGQLARFIKPLYTIKTHQVNDFNNFLVSFNGTPHVSRKLLVSALHKRKWFDPNYSTKNFVYLGQDLDGHIRDYVGNKECFYRKFFSADDENFNQLIATCDYNRFDHLANVKVLESRLTKSFVHVVSETGATEYTMFSEKPFYSIITRGLFLCYAGPYSHQWFTDMFGFRKYDTVFDYRFDEILNPIDRLIELLNMLSKFSNLTKADWHDLYLLEQENIEYNYDNFFSRQFENHYSDFLENLIAKNEENE